MDASTVTLIVAGLAVVVGIVVAVDLVRSRPRGAARARHPSAGPPLTITLAPSPDGAHWRVDLPAGRATTSIDIVTYRPIGSSAEWESEPIVEPIRLHPGGWALLPSVVHEPGSPHELIVGWTAHGTDADVTGSGRFVVDDRQGVVAPPAERSDRTWVAVGVVVIAMLLVAGGLVARELARTDGDGASATSPPVVAPASTTAATAPSTSAPPASSAPPPDSTTTSTSTPTTTSTSSSTSTSTPTSTSTSTLPDGPVVLIEGRVEDCRFGAV